MTDSKASIVFVVGYISFGGAAKIVRYVANHIVGYYPRVHILSLYETAPPESLDKRIIFDGLGISPVSGMKWRFRVFREVRQYVKARQPRIVVSFVSDIAVMTRIATLFLKRTTIVSAERGDPYTLPFIWKILVPWAYRQSDYDIFQLEDARDFFGKRVAAKSFVIPNPYITDKRVEPYNGERNKTIVAAGRFVWEKGFDVLIDAFEIIHSKYPDYRLIIWGDGPLLSEYKKQVADLCLSDFVSFPGYSKNVAQSIRQEGIFVLPSRYEGIPNALIEALSVGIPTVSSDCTPGGPSFLTDGGTRGLLVKKDDKDALAEAIIRLIDDAQLASSFQNEGPKIRDVLSESRIGQIWLDVFAQINKQS